MKNTSPEVTVASLMVTDVKSVTVDMTVKTAIGLLLKHGISGAPVIDSMKTVISVVSQSDLMKLAATKGLTATIGTCLQSLPKKESLVTLKRDVTFAELYRKFLATPVHRLIVIDDTGRLQGLVSRSTVLKVLYGPNGDKEETKAKEEANDPKKSA